MELDAAVLGGISQVAVFGATGDAIGYANVNAQRVDAYFSSPTGGIGQLPELPILAVTVPVNATAARPAPLFRSHWIRPAQPGRTRCRIHTR
jgi:hypothetical protein